MGWKLDDNTRSGIHSLVLGVLVVGALVLVNAGVDRLHAPLGPRGSFGHGYLIEADGQRLIVSDTTRGERLAAGLLLAIMAGGLSVLATSIIGRSFKGFRRWSWPLGRGVFAIAFLFFVYAAVRLPCSEFVGFRDRHLIMWDRQELFGDLPWPGTGKRIKLIPFDQVAGFKDTVQYLSEERVASWVLLLETDGTEIGIGNSSSIGMDDKDVLQFAEQRAQELNSSLHP